MLICYRQSTDPFLNIAAEEYFVHQATEDMCMIWLNEKSVIIGKHQNAYAEINYPFVKKSNIPVIRRISGGGAVYHDLGNINLTFIQQVGKSDPVDFGHFTTIFVKMLQSIGIEATVGNRNSLFIAGSKISGHAEHIFHGKVLHHGTILFNADLDTLANCLTSGKNFQSKSLPSVRSPVINLVTFLPKGTDVHHFINEMLSWFLKYFPASRLFSLSGDDVEAIQHLAEIKYKTWKWNFGYSPSYSFPADIQSFTGITSINVHVGNGEISQIEILKETGDQLLLSLLYNLKGVLHKEEEIEEFFVHNKIKLELAGVSGVNFMDAFFG